MQNYTHYESPIQQDQAGFSPFHFGNYQTKKLPQMSDQQTTYHKPVIKTQTSIEPDLSKISFLDAFNVENKDDHFLKSDFQPSSLLPYFRQVQMMIIFSNIKFPHHDKLFKGFGQHLISVSYIALAQKMFHTCFKQGDEYSKFNWLNYIVCNIPKPISEIIDLLGEMQTNFGSAKFIAPIDTIKECLHLACAFSTINTQEEYNLESNEEDELSEKLFSMIDESESQDKPHEIILSWKSADRQTIVLKKIELILKEKKGLHDQPIQARTIKNDAQATADINSKSFHDLRVIQVKKELDKQDDLILQELDELHEPSNEDMLHTHEFKTRFFKDVPERQSYSRDFRQESRNFKEQYILRIYTQLLKSKQLPVIDRTHYYDDNNYYVSPPTHLEIGKKYFGVDITNIDKDNPIANHHNEISILHLGKIDKDKMNSYFKKRSTQILSFFNLKFFPYLQGKIQFTEKFNATDQASFCQLGGRAIQFPISNLDHTIGYAFGLNSRVAQISSFIGRNSNSMEDIQFKLRRIDIQKTMDI